MLEIVYSNPNPPKLEKFEINKLNYKPGSFTVWSPSVFQTWTVIQGGREA